MAASPAPMRWAIFMLVATLVYGQWDQCNDPFNGFNKSRQFDYFPSSVSYFSDHSTTIRNYQSYKYYSTLELLSEPSVWVKVLLVRCGTEDPSVQDPGSFRDYIRVATPVKELGLTETLMVGLLDKGIGKLARVAAYLNKEDLNLPAEPQLIARLPQIQTWQCDATLPEAECVKESGCSFIGGKCSGAYGGPNNATKLNELNLSAIIVSSGSVDAYKAVTPTPVLPFSERFEGSPLGRLTWLLFMGLLTDAYSAASSHFLSTRSSYMQVAALAARSAYKPSVWMGTAFPGYDWYFPKPDSYVAKMMDDAHVYYMFSPSNARALAQPLQTLGHSGQVNNTPEALEGPGNTAVYAQGAEYYLPRAGLTENKVSEVVARNTAIDLKTWRGVKCSGGLIDYNKGGFPNPVFYDGIVNPDLLLKDVVYLTHPDLRGAMDYDTVYYMAYEQDMAELQCPVPNRIPVVPPESGKTMIVSVYKITGIRRQLIDIGLYEPSAPGKVSLYEELKGKLKAEELNLGFAADAFTGTGRRLADDNADLFLKVVTLVADNDASEGFKFASGAAAASITSWLNGQSNEGGSPTAQLDGEPLVYGRGPSDGGSDGLSAGAIVGITLGSVVVFLLLVFLAYLIYRRYRKRNEEEQRLRECPQEADVENPSVIGVSKAAEGSSSPAASAGLVVQ